jgi:hypothetical protein
VKNLLSAIYFFKFDHRPPPAVHTAYVPSVALTSQAFGAPSSWGDQSVAVDLISGSACRPYTSFRYVAVPALPIYHTICCYLCRADGHQSSSVIFCAEQEQAAIMLAVHV